MRDCAHLKDVAAVELASGSPSSRGYSARLGLAGWWAIGGIALTLLEAIVRLAGRAAAALELGLSPLQWLAFITLTLLFAYVEGYRAFQRRFVPRVLARACELSTAPRSSRCLAPLYAAGLVGAEAAALIRAWCGVALIVLAVLIVQRLPMPWRGIVDGAVAAALCWGLTALVMQLASKNGSERAGLQLHS